MIKQIDNSMTPKEKTIYDFILTNGKSATIRQVINHCKTAAWFSNVDVSVIIQCCTSLIKSGKLIQKGDVLSIKSKPTVKENIINWINK